MFSALCGIRTSEMELEELILCDAAAIKKEVEDPLSVEEMPVKDPLDSQTDAESESQITFKEEAISSWGKATGVENEESQEVTRDEQHPDIVQIDSKLMNQSLAPFIPSVDLQSPPRSPFDSVAFSCYSHAKELPVSSIFSLQIDQDDSSNASATRPEPAELNSPEIIYVDSDSENEQRDSQLLPSSNSNSESGAWSKNIEVSVGSGVGCRLEDNNKKPVTKHTDTCIGGASSSGKVILIKATKKPKSKQQRLVKNSEASSSSLLTPPADAPVPAQSPTALGETFILLQEVQKTSPASQQTTPPSRPRSSSSQQSLTQSQQTWSPIHQILALSSQLLSQQQSLAQDQGSQLLNQPPLTSVQQFVPSAQTSTTQSRVVPPCQESYYLAPSAKKPKLTIGANASETEAKQTTTKSQAEVNAGNVDNEREFLNLKHKMEVQELKLRLRNKKAKAELKESELKLKMEAGMQELTNKKLKHEILLAKLQFYSKLCATEIK